MLTLPVELANLIVGFAPLFSNPVWEHVQVLLVGAILAPGKRTVTSALRVMGLSTDERFQNYHRVLNRALWSSLAASRILLTLLVAAFAPEGVLVMGLDDTIERRRGEKIKAKGIYRDPVRSSRSHMVKASGLRWLSLMLLVDIPWASRCWALPFLTVLCPSQRYYQERGRTHQKLTERARQMLLVVKRWLPQREVVVVAERQFCGAGVVGGGAERGQRHHQIAPRCGVVRTGTGESCWSTGKTAHEGRTPADTHGGARVGAHPVAARDDCWLVRRSRASG